MCHKPSTIFSLPNTEETYLCRSMENFNLCRETSFLVSTSCLRFCWLLLWPLSAQLAIISSAPCEHFPSLWNGWWLCLDVAADLFKSGYSWWAWNTFYVLLPVWAIMCVQPLHTWITFSPPSSERFTRVGKDRKGSTEVSWPCLLLPHRNKSPSPAHMTEVTLLFIRQKQPQKEQSSNWAALVN